MNYICSMNATDLKTQIVRELDSFNPIRLKEFFGVMQNFIQSQKEDEYIGLSKDEIEKIEEAIAELENNKGISHELVMNEMRKKYSND